MSDKWQYRSGIILGLWRYQIGGVYTSVEWFFPRAEEGEERNRSHVCQFSRKFFGYSLGSRAQSFKAVAGVCGQVDGLGRPVGCDAADVGFPLEWFNWDGFSLSYLPVFIFAALQLRDVGRAGPGLPGRNRVGHKTELQSFVGFHKSIFLSTPPFWGERG